MARERGERREQILQILASMLERNPGGRITTAALATEVGVSEAALYRHFPSKARMFEGLIVYIEDTLFTRISRILTEESTALEQCEKILFLILAFVEKNPGISRVLNADALAGETERLRLRVSQIFDRLEAQVRQVLRDAELREGLRTQVSASNSAATLMAYTEGKISQYVRTNFRESPTANWAEHWQLLSSGLFRTAQAASPVG
ncbi:MAG TPA: nucleoid occlusion factor SlmA [Pseudomonadaceae bacterium]|nr:nucleoid occlusion factor SlmA [Pseudomonadaceae bacterium]